jgi:hypothetical protein
VVPVLYICFKCYQFCLSVDLFLLGSVALCCWLFLSFEWGFEWRGGGEGVWGVGGGRCDWLEDI